MRRDMREVRSKHMALQTVIIHDKFNDPESMTNIQTNFSFCISKPPEICAVCIDVKCDEFNMNQTTRPVVTVFTLTRRQWKADRGEVKTVGPRRVWAGACFGGKQQHLPASLAEHGPA